MSSSYQSGKNISVDKLWVGGVEVTGGGGGGGVSQIVAGNNVTVSPVSGVGAVTVNVAIPTSGVTKLVAGGGITLDPASGEGEVTVTAQAVLAGVSSLESGNTNLLITPATVGDVVVTMANDITLSGTVTANTGFVSTSGSIIQQDGAGNSAVSLNFDGTVTTTGLITGQSVYSTSGSIVQQDGAGNPAVTLADNGEITATGGATSNGVVSISNSISQQDGLGNNVASFNNTGLVFCRTIQFLSPYSGFKDLTPSTGATVTIPTPSQPLIMLLTYGPNTSTPIPNAGFLSYSSASVGSNTVFTIVSSNPLDNNRVSYVILAF